MIKIPIIFAETSCLILPLTALNFALKKFAGSTNLVGVFAKEWEIDFVPKLFSPKWLFRNFWSCDPNPRRRDWENENEPRSPDDPVVDGTSRSISSMTKMETSSCWEIFFVLKFKSRIYKSITQALQRVPKDKPTLAQVWSLKAQVCFSGTRGYSEIKK